MLARIGGGLLLLAIAVGFASARLGSTAQAGGFFGCGLLMLLGLVLWVHAGLCREAWSSRGDRGLAHLTVRGLALRNLARHPARSSLSIGLVAAASFLIVATNVFRLDPASETGDRRTGSGGLRSLPNRISRSIKISATRSAARNLAFRPPTPACSPERKPLLCEFEPATTRAA